MAIIAPKGTKDTLPSQVHKWHYVEQKFAEFCDKYGFKERCGRYNRYRTERNVHL